MLTPWHRSIRLRLITTLMLLVLAVAAFQVLFYPERQAEASLEALESKGRAMAELMAQSAAIGMEYDVREVIQEQVQGAARDPELVAMVVYEPDGSVYASYPKDNQPDFFSHEFSTKTTLVDQRGDVLWVSAPATMALGGGGYLLLGYTTDRIQDARAESQRLTWYVSLVILGIGGLIAAWLPTSVGARMSAMADVAARVAEGRVDIPPLEEGLPDELGRTARSLNTMLTTLRTLEGHVAAVATGDLTQDVRVIGDLADAVRAMIDNQRALVRQIGETSMEIRASSSQILATSRAQEAGANDEASFVEETVHTMDRLLEGSTSIGESSETVLDNASSTHENIRTIAERINLLAQHVQRIGEVLSQIREIAYKADLLALNAALEGTRAGEAGRGFSHVATQMQALTVDIVSAVEDIKQLTVDIRAATSASVLATEEASKHSADSADSATRIASVLRAQDEGTRQVGESMREVSEVIASSVTHASQLAATATQLSGLAERLQEQIHRFRVEKDGGSGPTR